MARLSFIERAAGGAVLGGAPKGASVDNAVADFERAVALEPDDVRHRLELARTYHLVHRDADARLQLDHAIALPPSGGAHDLREREEARKLLARLPRTP
jgi:thioredoxin-like negative regulator of GroEL